MMQVLLSPKLLKVILNYNPEDLLLAASFPSYDVVFICL
jgi:hypothetical protein